MSRSLRIAIADDEPDVLQYFSQALESWGHEVICAAQNGLELLQGCRVNRPDLLITDIRMDGLSGPEVVAELTNEAPLPTILISAHSRFDDLDEHLRGQIITLLTKPVKIETLRSTIESVKS